MKQTASFFLSSSSFGARKKFILFFVLVAFVIVCVIFLLLFLFSERNINRQRHRMKELWKNAIKYIKKQRRGAKRVLDDDGTVWRMTLSIHMQMYRYFFFDICFRVIFRVCSKFSEFYWRVEISFIVFFLGFIVLSY